MKILTFLTTICSIPQTKNKVKYVTPMYAPDKENIVSWYERFYITDAVNLFGSDNDKNLICHLNVSYNGQPETVLIFYK